VLGAEVHDNRFAGADRNHRELRDDAVFVFDLDRQPGQSERLEGASMMAANLRAGSR